MKIIAPDYYEDFKCIADKCVNSCCIGWEIDIDEDTLEYYRTLEGELAEKLKNNIAFEESTGYFILDENERCPFLKENGLCEIICEKGEEALCNICEDHPRFRNYFSERTEIGLGLCCESAAKLILEWEEKTKLIVLSSDGEEEEKDPEEEKALSEREKIFEILQNREKSVDERIAELVALAGEGEDTLIKLKDLRDKYFTLERLDEKWSEVLNSLKIDIEFGNIEEIAFEQFLIYLVFRHYADGEDSEERQRILLFIINAYRLIKALYLSEEKIELSELCRMFSAEVEYSDENLKEAVLF